MCACSCIVPENMVTNRLQVRVLGEHPPKQSDASHKYFLCGVEVGPIHQVEGHRVGGGMGIRTDGFGNRSVELAHGPNSVWGNFTAIQGSGEDKRPNNSLLVLMVPAERAEPFTNVCASVDAFIKRASIQPGACRNVRAKVPKVKDNLHTSVNDRPHMGSEPGPSSATSREKVTLEESNFGSNGMEE